MVALNTLLVAGTLAFSAGVLVTVLLGLLIAIYRNTKKDEEEDRGIYTIPASALMSGGGPPGGGMNGLMQLYHAAQVSKAAEEAEAAKKDKPEAALGGQYL